MRFNLQATGFDFDNARFCARASEIAYEPLAAEKWRAARELGFDVVEFVENVTTSTEGFVAANRDLALVSFRGTEAKLRDLLTDADVRRVTLDDRGVKVHEGFWNAMCSVRGQVRSLLARLRPPGRSVVFDGHSLGGSLAMACAYDYALAGGSVHAIYTFGEPRVGNLVFATDYDAVLGARTWRVVNQVDVVPRMPWLLGRFRHAGNEAFLNTAGMVQINPPLIPDKLFSDTVALAKSWRARHFAGFDELLRDHHIGEYIRVLNRVKGVSL